MPDRFLYDSLSTSEGGINSLLSPQLLPKNTLAWAINSTIRGGFIQPRPPRFRQTVYFPSDTVRLGVQNGFFQGFGYYRPDYGPQQLVAQISGRIFTFSPRAGINREWDCAEITIAGDPNSTTAAQAWFNQAEKWLIITDGSSKLPLFWDGVTLRRSYGPSRALATVTAVDNSTPGIGDVVAATLTDAYTGAYNIPVLFNGEFYQTLESSSPNPQYTAILTNIGDTPGNGIPAGTNIVVQSSSSALTVGTSRIYYPVSPTGTWILQWLLPASSAASFGVGNDIIYTGPLTTSYAGLPIPARITSKAASGTNFFFQAEVTGTLPTTPKETTGTGTISVSGSGQPTVVLAKTVDPFIVPAVNGTVTVVIDTAYTGGAGQTCQINDKNYTISPSAPPAPSNILNLLNLTDTSPIPAIPPNLEILSVPELPAGRMGAYGLGHQTMCLTDGISFIYGDTVGGPSGTQANNYRDAVLKTTENDFLDSRGSFKLPTSGEIINSMTFTAILDAAYGQGPLQIGTQSTIFTCAVPTNQADWAALENPIVTQTLIGKGPLGQNNTLLTNSDTLFRSTDGVGSLVYGRREFITNWGNTPISSEVYRALSQDDRSLLNLGSAVNFDNRQLQTNKPTSGSFGVFHQGQVAMNFDPVSSLKEKTATVWESLWTGNNILSAITGTFNNVERCMFFAFDETQGQIQLWEQLRSDTSEYLDNGTVRIQWSLETCAIFKANERDKSIPLVRLWNGRIHISNVIGEVHVKVQYRPDFWPCWVDWHEFDICATTDANNANQKPGYFDPIGLGEPSGADCESGNNRPMRVGRFFQVRVHVTGHCTINGMDFAAVPETTIQFPAPKCEVQACQDVQCELPDDYAYNLNKVASSDATYFGNVALTYQLCPSGSRAILASSVNCPGYIQVGTDENATLIPNSFYALTQAAANAQAQAALDAFVALISPNPQSSPPKPKRWFCLSG